MNRWDSDDRWYMMIRYDKNFDPTWSLIKIQACAPCRVLGWFGPGFQPDIFTAALSLSWKLLATPFLFQSWGGHKADEQMTFCPFFLKPSIQMNPNDTISLFLSDLETVCDNFLEHDCLSVWTRHITMLVCWMHGLSGLQGWERHCEGAQTGVPNRARSQMPRYAKILHIIGCCMGSASVVLAVDAETNRFQIVWNRLTWGGWSLGCMACRTWFKGTIVTWVCCCAFLGCNSALPGDDGKPCPIPECFWWVAITCSNWGWCRVSLLIWIAVEIGCRSTPGLFMEQSFYILLNSVSCFFCPVVTKMVHERKCAGNVWAGYCLVNGCTWLPMWRTTLPREDGNHVQFLSAYDRITITSKLRAFLFFAAERMCFTPPFSVLAYWRHF